MPHRGDAINLAPFSRHRSMPIFFARARRSGFRGGTPTTLQRAFFRPRSATPHLAALQLVLGRTRRIARRIQRHHQQLHSDPPSRPCPPLTPPCSSTLHAVDAFDFTLTARQTTAWGDARPFTTQLSCYPTLRRDGEPYDVSCPLITMAIQDDSLWRPRGIWTSPH